MSSSLDHSRTFIEAVLTQDDKAIDVYVRDILPRLMEYLRVTVKANHFHAEECAQHAVATVLERISRGNYEHDMNVMAYLLVSARNEYFAIIKRENREGSAVFHEMFFAEAEEQIILLADKDRERTLRKCLELLPAENRDFIIYLMQNPELSIIRISKIFNISPMNARTRKSRIITKLSDCYNRFSDR